MLAKRGRKNLIITSKNKRIKVDNIGFSNEIMIKKFHKLLCYLKEFGQHTTILAEQNKDCSPNYILQIQD